MSEKTPMSFLLVEDDVTECRRYKDYADGRTDIVFVGMTGSSFEAIRYLQTRMPEGVILDLELHKGKGSGLQFLADLKDSGMPMRPVVVVTTNSPSAVVYNHVHSNGADLVFYKRQADYNPELVINTMLSLRKSLHSVRRDDMPDDMQTTESPEERRIRITERINTELDLIGVFVKYKGRAYLQEAIFLLISKEKDSSEAVFYQVAENHRSSYSSVARAAQTAINSAWEHSSVEDLQLYYTARVNFKTGVPSPTEFIHYYADKIRKTM